MGRRGLRRVPPPFKFSRWNEALRAAMSPQARRNDAKPNEGRCESVLDALRIALGAARAAPARMAVCTGSRLTAVHSALAALGEAPGDTARVTLAAGSSVGVTPESSTLTTVGSTRA